MKTTAPQRSKQPTANHKLSFREQRELDQLPGQIETLEAEQGRLNARISDPTFYQGDHTEVSRVIERLKILETEIVEAYQRWVELEG